MDKERIVEDIANMVGKRKNYKGLERASIEVLNQLATDLRLRNYRQDFSY